MLDPMMSSGANPRAVKQKNMKKVCRHGVSGKMEGCDDGKRREGASRVWGNRKCETAEELIKQARNCSSSVQLFLLVCLDDNI